MNPPQLYMCSPSWTLLPPPSPLGRPSAPRGGFFLLCLDSSSCDEWDLLLHGIWNLPGPGIKPVSSAPADRFSTIREVQSLAKNFEETPGIQTWAQAQSKKEGTRWVGSSSHQCYREPRASFPVSWPDLPGLPHSWGHTRGSLTWYWGCRPSVCKGLHARAGEHRSASCHCPGKGHPQLYQPESTSKLLDPTGERSWPTLHHTTLFLLSLPAVPPLPVRWPEEPQGVLNLAFWISLGWGSRKRKKGNSHFWSLPLCQGWGWSRPTHSFPCESLPTTLQCPEHAWVTDEETEAHSGPLRGNKCHQPVCLAAFTWCGQCRILLERLFEQREKSCIKGPC